MILKTTFCVYNFLHLNSNCPIKTACHAHL